jgi:hypothetical protein
VVPGPDKAFSECLFVKAPAVYGIGSEALALDCEPLLAAEERRFAQERPAAQAIPEHQAQIEVRLARTVTMHYKP